MRKKLIAEIGINHNGSVRLAIAMMLKAKECGADYVKFQKRDINLCYTKEELEKPCESPWGDTVFDKVSNREFSWGHFDWIDEECRDIGIEWTASCFDTSSLEELHRRFSGKLPFHKVPSCMAKHREFLEQVASYKKLTIVSVGLAESLEEITEVGLVFHRAQCPFVLNVTTPLYPTPIDRCGLARIELFREKFLGGYMQAVGYSGHETGILPSTIAGLLGAEYIERHFTLDRTLYGADQAASLEPDGLSRLRRDLDCVEKLFGASEVALVGDEKNPVPLLNPGACNES